MAVLAFPPYSPDISDYQNNTTQTVLNVLPRLDGYGPAPGLLALSSALAAACRGFFYARNSDGTITVFAGTSTKLYKMSNTDFTWSDVSQGAGAYSALPATGNWSFAQFNNFVIAVQANINPQVFDLTISTAFADLGGSPPQAAYVSIVNRFLVLSGLAGANNTRIQWSGLNATTTWTSGVNSSDFQDLPDGGTVRGIAGGEYGVIFQDGSIRRMTYAPGSPLIFVIDRVSLDDGMFAPYSLVWAGDKIFFCSPQGFKMLVPGAFPQPIGKERVDRTFFADLDTGNLQLFQGAHDPRASRVFWAYKSVNGSTGLWDKVLVYDYAIDKWSILQISGEYIASLSRPGMTLEGLDSVNTSIDALTGSLDDYSTASLFQFAGVDSTHKLGFFNGPNLEATLVSSEQGTAGQRIFVKGFRPITDATSIFGTASARETLQASASYVTEAAVDSLGRIPLRVSTRYSHGKIRIPAASTWTYAMGIEPDVTVQGLK